jgi:signal transduction histidine kinase
LARVLSNLSQREADRAREIARLIRQTNTRMREVARGLTPVGLESRGLGEALRNLAADTEKLFGIACRFQANASEENPDLQFGIQLYRIAQEAVSNAIKHGRAKRIRIALRRNRRSLQLSVMDNGSGISKSLRHHDGIGLHVMRHRAEAIGATLKMQRNRSGGMTVVCAVKLPAMHNGLK